jgi:hypothetical protein
MAWEAARHSRTLKTRSARKKANFLVFLPSVISNEKGVLFIREKKGELCRSKTRF